MHASWQLQTAKARLSEVVREAKLHGPQTITVRGEPEAVVVSLPAYRRMKMERSRKQLTLLEVMQQSPLAGLDIDFTRDKSPPRELNLFDDEEMT